MFHADIEERYERFQRMVQGRTGPRAWIAFVLAQPKRCIAVSLFGLAAVVLTAAVPPLFDSFETDVRNGDAQSRGVFLLITTVLLAATVSWFKERAELRLVFDVRFLAFRAYFDQARRKTSVEHDTQAGRFATHPPQISQLAYLIDLVLTIIQAIAISGFVLITFGVVGIIAFIGTLVATVMTIVLVHKIGAIYGRYITLESARVDRIGDLSEGAPILRRARMGGYIQKWMQNARTIQEPVLRERARLQIINGMVIACAVPTVVTVAALSAFFLSGVSTQSLISLLVATGLLSVTLQEAVTNYRVIRLCVPMLRQWDDARRTEQTQDNRAHDWFATLATERWLRIEGADQAAEEAVTKALHDAAEARLCVVIPPDPKLPGELVQAWYQGLATGERGLADQYMESLRLPENLWGSDGSRLDALSRGERVRLALAICLTSSELPCVITTYSLGALDANMRATVHQCVVAAGRTLIISGSFVTGLPSDRHSLASLVDDRIVLTAPIADVDVGSESITAPDASLEREAPKGSQDKLVDGSAPPLLSPAPTFRSSIVLMTETFGRPGFAAICLAAVIAAILGAVLPMALDAAPGGASSTTAWTLFVLMVMILGSNYALYRLQYTIPISRLSAVHDQIAGRLEFAGDPRRTGEFVGRFGEDFSGYQMDVPARLVGALAILTAFGVLVIAAGISSPAIAVLSLILAPIAFWLYRRGERRLVTAATKQAAARGPFLGLATVVVDNPFVIRNRALAQAADAVYRRWEANFADASRQVIKSMMVRRFELQAVSLSVFAFGLAGTVIVGPANQLVAPAVLAYFAYMIGMRLPALIESLQGVSVALATGHRVKVLRDLAELPNQPLPVPSQALQELREAITSAPGSVIRVDGPTGAGKSISLRALQHECEQTLLLEDDIPTKSLTVDEFVECVPGVRRPESCEQGAVLASLTRRQRQAMLLEYALATDASLVIFDETFSSYTPIEQQAIAEQLAHHAKNENRTFLLVSHTVAGTSVSAATVRIGY